MATGECQEELSSCVQSCTDTAHLQLCCPGKAETLELKGFGQRSLWFGLCFRLIKKKPKKGSAVAWGLFLCVFFPEWLLDITGFVQGQEKFVFPLLFDTVIQH